MRHTHMSLTAFLTDISGCSSAMSIDIGLLMDPIDGLTPEIDSSTNISVIDEDARSEVSSTATFHSVRISHLYLLT